MLGDRGYDAAAIRHGLRARHILPLLAMRRTKHGSGLGRWRWVVERTFAWLNQFRRVRVRYDKRADIHEAFLTRLCVDLLAVAAQELDDGLRIPQRDGPCLTGRRSDLRQGIDPPAIKHHQDFSEVARRR